MKKLLWFSRHEMSREQKEDLGRIYGDVEIFQVNKTISSAYEIADDIATADILAVVAPINLQEQFLKLAKEKPVISCRSKRILTPTEDGGEEKVTFVFDGWYQIKKIEVVTEDL